jgi:adenine-specific DNA-methyltransferase
VIKYLGSKRRLVPVLGRLLTASGARTALDLFTGTTRVAQEFCRRGAVVTAVDLATYSEVLAQCYVATDAATVDPGEVHDALSRLEALEPRRGYFTRTFCERARYLRPENGMRVDAIREGIDAWYPDGPLRPILLTSLLEAADAVDSTVGLQMAYLKAWAPRAYRDLRLRVPTLTPGAGAAVLGDAATLVRRLPPVELAYLDPPYNQHRYFTNYHVWETLVRWDDPPHYGVACKRLDCREPATRSVFNSRPRMPAALARTVAGVRADVLVVSASDEGFVPLAELVAMCAADKAAVEVLAFDSRRYVGALIGIHGPTGERVGSVGRTRNTEYLVIAGPEDRVQAMVAAMDEDPAAAPTPNATASR